MVGRWHLGVAAALVAAVMSPAHALAAEEPGRWGSGTGDSNVRVDLYLRDIERLTREKVRNEVDGPWFEYSLVSICGGQPGTPNGDDLCGASFIPCSTTNPQIGAGPAMRAYRREVNRAGAPQSDWTPLGVTCLPDRLPGGRAALTLALVQQVFNETEFAVPTVNIQPEGDVTLVNLPTFFEVRFPDEGFGPDEVDTPDPARLLGYRVEVRPVLRSVTYHLGEKSVGPTRSLGGPHPTGDVRVTYTRPGTHQVRADIVYTGQFRVGGSGWIDIPGQVDLRGTPVTLTVREAKARLYTS